MDDPIWRNLDTQSRRLAELEASLDALLAGDLTVEVPEAPAGDRARFDELTAVNDALRAERQWTEVDLDAALTPAQRELFARWQSRQRVRWSGADLVAVGLAGVVGMAATWFDMTIDQSVRQRLGMLKDTDLVKGWEKDAKRLAIDYTGPGFGGPGHRVRSAGHDLGRPLNALRQIRDGQFKGTTWTYGTAETFVKDDGFVMVNSWGEALTLWGKHLAADVVTPMSLPLPGWTLLYERPSRDLRKFAAQAYEGTPLGTGLNVRSGLLTPTLSLLTTEAIIRTHVHARAYADTGSPVLDAGQTALLSELLLCAHGLVGAACLGKTLTAGLLTPQGPLAVRHVNVPVLLRLGALGSTVVREHRARGRLGAPSWSELLTDLAQPWQLDSATQIEASAAELADAG